MKVVVVELARLYKAKACLANFSARHAFAYLYTPYLVISLTASVYCDVISFFCLFSVRSAAS